MLDFSVPLTLGFTVNKVSINRSKSKYCNPKSKTYFPPVLNTIWKMPKIMTVDPRKSWRKFAKLKPLKRKNSNSSKKLLATKIAIRLARMKTHR